MIIFTVLSGIVDVIEEKTVGSGISEKKRLIQNASPALCGGEAHGVKKVIGLNGRRKGEEKRKKKGKEEEGGGKMKSFFHSSVPGAFWF